MTIPYQPYRDTLYLRTTDFDAWDRLRTSALLRLLEQIAVEASAFAGFGKQWYEARQAAWVIREMTLLRLGSAGYGDGLAVSTWISEFARFRAARSYEVRAPDGTPVATGLADWVYLDRRRLLPARVDPAIAEMFTPLPPSPLMTLPAALPPALPRDPHLVERRAYRYEADSMGHVNNAVYQDWLEEAADAALLAWGYPLAAPAAPGLQRQTALTRLTYLRAARPGDALTITTVLTGADGGGERLTLAQEVSRGAGPPELLMRAESRHRLIPSGAEPPGRD